MLCSKESFAFLKGGIDSVEGAALEICPLFSCFAESGTPILRPARDDLGLLLLLINPLCDAGERKGECGTSMKTCNLRLRELDVRGVKFDNNLALGVVVPEEEADDMMVEAKNGGCVCRNAWVTYI